jgi:SAM-dependent methyltransferase
LTLHAGAREHYVHAGAYRDRYASRAEDRDYYVALARRVARALGPARPASVLEYGAGTGRLTLPLAEAGLRVLAVDASAPMLEELLLARDALPPSVRARVSARVADMRSFTSRRRHHLAIAGFHTFCHLYSQGDVVAFLGAVERQLLPGGLLAFDVPMPRVDLDGYDPIAQVRVTHMDGPAGPELLSLRVFQLRELEMHLYYAGFEGIRLTADFTGRPVDQETDVVVVQARKAARC